MIALRAIALGACLGVGVAACGDALPSQRAAIGAACARDSDCGTGDPFRCDTTQPGGACTRRCSVDADCPAEAVCVGPVDGGDGRACRASCDASADCRASYTCASPSSEATQGYCSSST